MPYFKSASEGKKVYGQTHKFRFETNEEAETYYWENLAKHNDDHIGLECWMEDNADDIKECYLENHPKQ